MDPLPLARFALRQKRGFDLVPSCALQGGSRRSVSRSLQGVIRSRNHCAGNVAYPHEIFCATAHARRSARANEQPTSGSGAGRLCWVLGIEHI
jgi:hypothetical protein